MKLYFIALAVYTALSFAGTAKADLDDLLSKPGNPEPTYRQRQIDRDGLQMRMNQQYRQQLIQDRFDQQQQELQQEIQREHMRNNGWGRPGLDGGYGK